MTDNNLLNYFNRHNVESYSPDLTGITRLRNYCFESCTNMNQISIPRTITSVGNYCFIGCSALSSIDLSNCTSLTSIGSYCFSGCRSLTSVNLSNCTSLTSIGSYCFYECGLLTSVNFSGCSNLKTLGNYCFNDCSTLTSVNLSDCTSLTSLTNNVFYYCNKLESVELPSSLTSISSTCFYVCNALTTIRIHKPKDSISGAPWGATNATVIWDMANIEYNVSPADASVYVDGVLLESSPTEVSSMGEVPYTIYHKDYLPVSGVLSGVVANQTYTINTTMTDTNGYKVTISPDQADATIIMSYGDFSVASNYVVVPENTEVTYIVKKKGYKTVKNTITPTSTQTISVTMEISSTEEVNLSYPFDASVYSSFTMDNLIDGSNFVIDETNSAIINGSKSYNVNSGLSHGYIEFTTPSEETTVSVTGYVSSENNWDFGAVYVGTEIYKPTYSQCRNQTTDGNGNYVFVLSGTSNTSNTYTLTLQPETKYYMNFIYVKDSSGNSGQDRMYITNIQFKAEPV